MKMTMTFTLNNQKQSSLRSLPILMFKPLSVKFLSPRVSYHQGERQIPKVSTKTSLVKRYRD